MTRVRSLWHGFFAGTFFTLLVHLIPQDYLGKERFLAHVQDNWLDLPWWPWVVLWLVGALSLYGTLRKLREQDNAQKLVEDGQ